MTDVNRVTPPKIVIEDVDETRDVGRNTAGQTFGLYEEISSSQTDVAGGSGALGHTNTLKLPARTLELTTGTDEGGRVTIHMPDKANGSPRLRKRHSSKDEDMKHLTQDKLLLAQTLIKDAEIGRNFTYKTDPIYVRFYILYHKWYFRWTLYGFIVLNMALAFLEKPTKPEWEQPVYATMLLELVCLAFFVARVIHSFYFSLPHIFWKDTKNIIVIGVISLTLIDMVCYIIWVSQAPDSHPVRWSRPLRALLIINFSDGRQIRRAFRNIRRTVPEIFNVLVLYMMSLCLAALLALKLFGRRKKLIYPDGMPYFKTFADSMWDLYVLVTTANNPDVMMPAYDENKWFALFFIAYLIICLYIFMSIILAAIYNNYRNNLKNEIRDAVYGKRKKLREAFDILKVERNGDQVITRPVWIAIMERVLPGKSQSQIELLMTILDKEGSGTISKRNFVNLVNLLQVPVTEVHDRRTFLEEKFPAYYNSKVSNFVKVIVRHKYFRHFFDFMIFLNAWFIGFDLDDADWGFLAVFMLEIALKLYVHGPREFFKRLWNVFDFFVIGSAVVVTAVETAAGDDVGEELSALDLLLVLRIMRLIKIFASIKRFKVILLTILNIGPTIMTYGGVIFVLYYIFAIIGTEVFHGLVHFYGYNETDPSQLYCGNPALEGSVFYRNYYCNNNFNNIVSSFVILSELMVVNQWHVLASGFVIVTSKAARIYFILFHISCVLIVLNIFVAFILEAFILEYSLQNIKKGKLETEVDRKIKELGLGIGQKGVSTDQVPKKDKLELVSNEEEVSRTPPPSGPTSVVDSDSDTESIPDLSNEDGLRFHLKKRSRKNVEVLLQQMFEVEINQEDEMKNEERERTVTLNSYYLH